MRTTYLDATQQQQPPRKKQSLQSIVPKDAPPPSRLMTQPKLSIEGDDNDYGGAYGEESEETVIVAKCRTIDWWAFWVFLLGSVFANFVYFTYFL